MRLNFSDTWLDELRGRVDIVDMISRYVRLTQKGKKHMGLCPFHTEKTPSFSVDSQMQMFYCFGCHKGGTAIHFYMEMERLTFPEAVTALAEQTGLSLPAGAPQKIGLSGDAKQRLYDANRAAARYYFDKLFTPEGGAARTYLHERGISDATIRRFGLGAAGAQRGELLDALKTAGFTETEIVSAGLCIKRDSGVFDMFRDRVMFPIVSAQGEVLGFGGRGMAAAAQPKYINTADTPVFNKRLGLFGLNILRKQRSLTRVILVEGYMDLITLNQADIEGVAATLGTALTPEQAKLIKRYAPEVFICYDGDAAGVKATLRALDIFAEANIPARVLSIPSGSKDPDEFIKLNGADAFSALLPIPGVQFRLNCLRADMDLFTQDGRMKYAQAACGVIGRLPSPVEREDYIKKLALDTGYSPEALITQMGVTPPYIKARTTPRRAARLTRLEIDYVRAERMLIAMLASGTIKSDMIAPGDFSTPLYKNAAEALISGRAAAAILDDFSDDERDKLAGAFEELPPDADQQPDLAVKQCLECIARQKRAALLDKLKGDIERAEGDQKRQLLKQYAQLSRG